MPRPDFVLTDTGGRSFDLRRETGGWLTLLLFGYLDCPDVCPIQMATKSAVLHRDLGVDPLVVFVAVDPDRDSPARVREWLDHFDIRFIGLTGTLEQLERAQLAAGVPASVLNPKNPDGSYSVGPASQVVACTGDDQCHLVFPFGTRQEGWVHDLPLLVDDAIWARR